MGIGDNIRRRLNRPPEQEFSSRYFQVSEILPLDIPQPPKLDFPKVKIPDHMLTTKSQLTPQQAENIKALFNAEKAVNTAVTELSKQMTTMGRQAGKTTVLKDIADAMEKIKNSGLNTRPTNATILGVPIYLKPQDLDAIQHTHASDWTFWLENLPDYVIDQLDPHRQDNPSVNQILINQGIPAVEAPPEHFNCRCGIGDHHSNHDELPGRIKVLKSEPKRVVRKVLKPKVLSDHEHESTIPREDV